MAEYELRYGKGAVTVSLPEERVLHVVMGAPYPAIINTEKALVDALEHPVGTPPLHMIVHPGETVCIVVSDITRAWIHYERFLPTLLDYLNDAGIPDTDIFLLVAYGAHRKQSEAEHRMCYGEDVCRRVRIEHSCAVSEDCHYRHQGVTSRGVPIEINELALDADRVILTGGLVYHMMAGYGAGRKAVLPGISSYEAIQKNHVLCLSDTVGGGCNPDNYSSNISTNRMHADQLEHAQALNADFLINVINNADNQLARFVTGHWQQAWEDGIHTVDEIFKVPITAKADCVIASAGGYPKDINLYQGIKTQDNATKAVRPGGVIILLMELEDSQEPPEFINWFRYDNPKEHEMALRRGFTVPGFISLHVVEDLQTYTHIFVTLEKNRSIIEQTGAKMATTVEEALAMAEDILGDAFTINILPTGSTTMPVVMSDVPSKKSGGSSCLCEE